MQNYLTIWKYLENANIVLYYDMQLTEGFSSEIHSAATIAIASLLE
jgi:hypothetical protein